MRIMLKRIITTLALAVAALGITTTPAYAAVSSVNIYNETNLYPEADVVLSAPGVVTYDSRITSYVTSGSCLVKTVGTVGPHQNPTKVGYTCSTAATIHLTLPVATFACTGDPGVWQPVSTLRIVLDGVEAFSRAYGVRGGECWATPLRPATVTWNGAGILTFDNSTQARNSAGTSFSIIDPAWKFSEHVVTAPTGISCSPKLVYVSVTRWIHYWAEGGTFCTGSVPANSISVVTIS